MLPRVFLYQLDPSVTSNLILFVEWSDLVERKHCTVKTVHRLAEDRGIHWRKTFVDVPPVGKRGAEVLLRSRFHRSFH